MADAMKLVPVPRIKPEIVSRLLDFVEVHAQSEDEHDREEAAAIAVICARMNAAASPPAREEAPAEGAGDERTIDGETVLGFKVAAWRYQNASDADGAPYGYRYCDHWSTPGNGAKAVERLFTETQLRTALRDRTSEPEAGAVACKATLGTRGDCSTIAGCDCPAPATADKLRVAKEALEFFKWARNFFWCEEGSEIDGGDFQDAAERIGLIVKVPFDPDRHTDNGYGLEAGDDWFETAPHIAQALATLNEQPQ